MRSDPFYLGDGVYASVDELGRFALMTENGIRTTNRIILEPEVLEEFMDYVERERSRAKGGRS